MTGVKSKKWPGATQGCWTDDDDDDVRQRKQSAPLAKVS
jgi:hypothetical protein